MRDLIFSFIFVQLLMGYELSWIGRGGSIFV